MIDQDIMRHLWQTANRAYNGVRLGYKGLRKNNMSEEMLRFDFETFRKETVDLNMQGLRLEVALALSLEIFLYDQNKIHNCNPY